MVATARRVIDTTNTVDLESPSEAMIEALGKEERYARD
jgi:hypothetical protein